MDDTGWEAGPLGNPITDHTDLPNGLVPGFQDSAIHRLDGQDGYWVRGGIRDRWNRSAYENGPLACE
ncbi:LGFP repeat-containing protein [Nocardia sp. 2YAB30]|uniref:LGFP repeat-containing protein n=1 Tax=Nocardia sp. 2YAB30 TaxID=3233022 RepID=UPI003F95E160